MLPDPYDAHADVSGGTISTHPFSLVSLAGNASVRENFALTIAGKPKTLKISHSVVGKGASARDRHLVRLESYVVEDGVENPAKPIAFYTVLDIPQVGVTATQLSDMFIRYFGMWRGDSGDAANQGDQTEFFDRIVNGES